MVMEASIVLFQFFLVLLLVVADKLLVPAQCFIASERMSSCTVRLTRGPRKLRPWLFYSLLVKVFKTEPELVTVLVHHLSSFEEIPEEHVRHLHWSLIDSGTNTSLQNHLENLGIRRFLISRGLQLGDLFLDVLYGNFNGSEHYLFALNHLDTCLDVRKVMARGQDGLALVLLV